MTITAGFVERPATTGEDDGHASRQQVPIGHSTKGLPNTEIFGHVYFVRRGKPSIGGQRLQLGVDRWEWEAYLWPRMSSEFGPDLKRRMSSWLGAYKD